MSEPIAGAASEQRCAIHADVAAQGTCERCGSFLCESCRGKGEDNNMCVACVERRNNAPPSRAALTALIVALLGPLGLIPGVVGGVLGHLELRRIRQGRSPPSGEGYAVLARALGVFFGIALAVSLLTLA